MGKKVREYKSGDFIFAKVKGYPAWPARVQRPNGKKYFVYFYGTGETANLPPNMIFDYAENKDKFLTKTVKRRDFNDGVKQIEYDFANNVPLEEVIGVPLEAGAEAAVNDTANDSAIDATMNDSGADTANDTVADDANATQNDAVVEDSDDAGALVIDEGKTPAKGRKSKVEAKPKETPKAKEPKTPRGRGKKEEAKEKDEESEELVSRSGRKIRPKRYIDEQTEENATLPSPAPKRRRGASPAGEKEKADAPKENAKEKEKDKDKEESKGEKSVTQFNVVKQSELENLKEVFKPADEDKDNILIAYLPSGAYAGIKLFQSRPRSFKNEATRLQWDKQAARNALTLKMQLEREHITPLSVQGQLVLDLNLTDEEKATLDKERETEEKKSRVNFLKTEMKLIELDAKIKTCLCLEKADTELCLKLLDELLGLEVKPLMLLKHPTCLETVKRMRAYVGNTPSWDLNESDALAFSKQAHKIRKKADLLYKNMKEHFQTPEGLSFWEYFSERVLIFKKVTATLNAGELLELVHEPIELSQPNTHSMRAAIDQANNTVPPLPDSPEIDEEDEKQAKKKAPAGKSKKQPPPTPSKSKRSTRGKKEEENTEAEAEKPEESVEDAEKPAEENGESVEKEKTPEDVPEETGKDAPVEPETTAKDTNEDVEMAEPEKVPETEENQTEVETETNDTDENEAKEKKSKADKSKDTEKEKSTDKAAKKDKKAKETSEKSEMSEKSDLSESGSKEEESGKEPEKKERKNSKDSAKNGKESEKSEKSGKEKEDVSEDKNETKDDKDSGEPRAKRSRETKKTEPPPPRSPAKRKSKF